MNRSGLPPSPVHHARGVTLMLASAACFTANVLLIRALGTAEAVNVWLVSCTRFIVGLAILLLVSRRDLAWGRLFTHGRLVRRGIIGGAGVYAFYLTVVHLGAGRATFINNTYVIFGALLAVWMLGERFGAALAVGSVAALTGLALLTNAFAGGLHASLYDLLAVASALASGYIVVTIRQLHATDTTATIFAAQCVYGLLICGGPAILQTDALSWLAWAGMALAGASAAVGQITMTAAFRHLPVAEGSLLQMLVPLGVALGGTVFFQETFAAHELVGAVLILLGTAFTVARR